MEGHRSTGQSPQWAVVPMGGGGGGGGGASVNRSWGFHRVKPVMFSVMTP